MQLVMAVLTLAAFGLAGYLWWVEGTANYLIALVAGQLGALLSPLWQLIYHYTFNDTYAPAFQYLGHTLPRVALFGGWVAILPALIIFFLNRQRWWFPGYMTSLLTFVVFVVYHMLVEALGTRMNIWAYVEPEGLPLGLRISVLMAFMNSLVSLGMLSLLLLTRRYGLMSLLMIALPAPFVLNLFVRGILGAPLYVVLFLQERDLASGWAIILGALGSLGLLLWAVHMVASVIDGQQLHRPVSTNRAQVQN